MFRYYFIILMFCSSCQSTLNFTDDNMPVWKYESNAVSQHIAVNSVRMLTYNIQYSKMIEEAISEFESLAQLKNADILFLQEMDSIGVELIAQELDLNSVYFPASTHGKQRQYFGNAILSKWPLSNVHKIILPHLSMSKRQRIAVAATLEINDFDIHLINVHLETMTMRRGKRMDQIKTIISFMNEHYPSGPLIIAGDFNSFFPKDRREFSALMSEAGLDWLNHDMKFTAKAVFGLIKPKIDLVFARDFKLLDIGVETRTQASDHFPVWLELELPRE